MDRTRIMAVVGNQILNGKMSVMLSAWNRVVELRTSMDAAELDKAEMSMSDWG